MDNKQKTTLIAAGIVAAIILLIVLLPGKGSGDNSSGAKGSGSNQKAPPPKDFLLSIKIGIKEPKLKALGKGSGLNNRFFTTEDILARVQSLNSLSFDHSPDLAMILNVEGSTEVFTDGRVHNESLDQQVITTIKLPPKFEGRECILDLWDDDKNDNEISNLFGSVTEIGGGIGEIGFIKISGDKLGELTNNSDDRIAQLEFDLTRNLNVEKSILSNSPFTETEVKAIHTVLLISSEYDPWISNLQSENVLVKKDGQYFFVIGTATLKVFEDE